MSDRYKLRDGRLCPLRQTTLGFSGALAPPKVYLPSQRGYKYGEATEIHERCHATLINSTIYGIAEQVLTYLLKTSCPHIEQQILERAYGKFIEQSFTVHEGCATLCEIGHIESTKPDNMDDFKATIPKLYQNVVSRFSIVVDLFGFQGYLRNWLAIQIAAVCLCPPLFGPLSNYNNYKSGRVVDIFEDENISPDKRLDKLIMDGTGGRLSKLIEEVKKAINYSVNKTFSPSGKPDFQDDSLRYDFIRTCEPLVEKCFAEAYRKFYVHYRTFLKEWGVIWLRMSSEFQEAGCSCLSRFSFEHRDLLEEKNAIRPVAIANRKDHPEAIELDKLSNLPIQKNDEYYVALHFNEKQDAETVCYNPLRELREGHLYARFQRFQEAKGSFRFDSFYWFKFFTPAEIPGTLTSIARIPGIIVCPMCGHIDRVITRLKECNRHSVRSLYLQIDGITAEGFLFLIKALPSPIYEMFTWWRKHSETEYCI